MKSIFLAELSLFAILNLGGSFKINGSYKVVFDEKYKSDAGFNYIITFRNNTYVKKMPNGEKIDGQIRRIVGNDNKSTTIHLEDLVNYIPERNLDTLLYESFGKRIIEFEENSENTLYFRTTYAANLHITVNEGKLIRIK